MEWNAVDFYRICCMARSLCSLRQVATLRHGHMVRRSASLRSCIQGTRGMCTYLTTFYKFRSELFRYHSKNLVCRPEDRVFNLIYNLNLNFFSLQSQSQSFYLKNSISISISVFTSSIFQYFSRYFNKMPKDNLFI